MRTNFIINLRVNAFTKRSTALSSFIIGVLLFTALAAGTEGGAQAQERFSKERLSIQTSDGARHEFDIELAVTPGQRGQGLMFRRELAADAGMLFLYEREEYRFMWMKNTYIALDMLFIARDGQVVDLVERTEPLSTKAIRSNRPAMAVLEIAGGTSSKLGIGIGASVIHQAFGNDLKSGSLLGEPAPRAARCRAGNRFVVNGGSSIKNGQQYLKKNQYVNLCFMRGCPRIENLLRKSPFGQISRSFSLNSHHYSPQMIEKSDSKWFSLATAPILGQPPRLLHKPLPDQYHREIV